MPTETIEIKCYANSIFLDAARETPALAIPFGIIDSRLREIATLIVDDGTDRMKEIMERLGYLNKKE